MVKSVTQRNITRLLDEWKLQRSEFYHAVTKSSLGIETAMLKISISLGRAETGQERHRGHSCIGWSQTKYKNQAFH